MIAIQKGQAQIVAKDLLTAWEMAETWEGRRPDYERDLKNKGWKFFPSGASQ